MISSSRPSTLLHEVITFYSYKGGTGRSMALANIACLLARSLDEDNKILVVDWDLEAPGLHYYLLPPESAAFNTGHRGVVELFTKIHSLVTSNNRGEHLSHDPDELLKHIELSGFLVATRAPNVLLMCAGFMDETYQTRLAAINWEGLYKQCPGLYQTLAVQLAQEYAMVFVDSRTGMTDTSNICTSLLPDKLVVVFTPNRQSLTGVETLVKQCIEYRRHSSDLRPLMVYPLPSRIDGQYEVLRRLWRNGDTRQKN